MQLKRDSSPFLQRRGLACCSRESQQSLILYFLEFTNVTEYASEHDQIQAAYEKCVDADRRVHGFSGQSQTDNTVERNADKGDGKKPEPARNDDDETK